MLSSSASPTITTTPTKHFSRCGLTALLAVGALVAHSSAAVTVTALPGLGPDYWELSDVIEQSRASGINNAGVVVGATGSNPHHFGEGEAVRWTGGAIEVLPRLPDALSNGLNFAASDINEGGIVVGFTAYPIMDNQFASHAAKWTSDAIIDLGALPGHDSSIAGAINASGEVAGGSSFGGYFGTRLPVRWSVDGQIAPLGLLLTQDAGLIAGGQLMHDRGTTNDINASGRIVGSSELFGFDFPGERLPVYWDDATATVLPLPTGFNNGQAAGINDGGMIVGEIANLDLNTFTFSSFKPVVWSDANTEPLVLALPIGVEFGYATAVNSLGQIIGGGAANAESALYRFATTHLLWNFDGSFLDLTPHLEAAFPSETDFDLTDINDHGQIIGFTGGSIDERNGVAFVLSIPEPASGSLILLALVTLPSSGLRRSRRVSARSMQTDPGVEAKASLCSTSNLFPQSEAPLQ